MKATHTLPTSDLDTGMTPADLLRGAALYLRRHGRITGEFFDLLADAAFPPACTLGAINICAHGRPILSSDDVAEDPYTDAAIRAMRVLAAHLDTDYARTMDIFAYTASAIDIVSGFNDDPDTTDDDAINALTEAADDWDRAHTTGGAR
jgi:hypothetical protein